MRSGPSAAPLSEKDGVPPPPGLDDSGNSGYGTGEVPPTAAKPSNMGSKNHPDDCKPCNKFNPARPDDSCKHGNACAFCHGAEHERPKHRGQRGRHALQRRQYLEARDKMPEELREIVDKVYQEPPLAMENVKKILLTLDLSTREMQVQRIVEDIAHIGDVAQDKRPDNTRIRGLRMESTEYTTASDLDSRFKWLTGTLHLMIRKMMDDEKITEEMKFKAIADAVTDVLEQVRQLPHQLEERLLPLEGVEENLEKVLPAADTARSWLRKKVQELATAALMSQAVDEGNGQEELLQDLARLGDLLQQLPSFANESEDAKGKLEECKSLKEMHQRLEVLIAEIKDRLFDDDFEIDFTALSVTAQRHSPEEALQRALAGQSKQATDPENLRFT